MYMPKIGSLPTGRYPDRRVQQQPTTDAQWLANQEHLHYVHEQLRVSQQQSMPAQTWARREEMPALERYVLLAMDDHIF